MSFRNYIKSASLAGYYAATLPYRKWSNARRAARAAAPIMVLFYHRIADDGASIGTHSNRLFRRQIAWLQKRCDLISLEEAQRRIRNGYNDRLAASITFDDGYADNCEQALPLLIEQKIPCTYFVSSRHALEGRPFAHDLAAGIRALPNTIQQLRWMADHGIEIGAHTRNHADLGRIRDEVKLHDEVVVAGEELQSTVGHPIRYFAFPYGMPKNLNVRAVQMAIDYGYEGICSAYGDYNFPGNDPFHIRRIHVDDMLRLKNWATIDPRHLRPAYRFEYQTDREYVAQSTSWVVNDGR